MDDAPLENDSENTWLLALHKSIHSIAPEDWDRCAGLSNPIETHAFFAALEDSNSATQETGWYPSHCTLSDSNKVVQGVLPFYLKTHSYGEYVFDHAWSHAWQNAGGRYYPKGQSGIPFTPVPGQRFMGTSPEAIIGLANGVIQAGAELEVSSLHVPFLTEKEAELITSHNPDWIKRDGMQFHWQNQDYTDFDDFLENLTSRKRKSIRRERRSIIEAGISFKHLSGDDLTPQIWDAFYEFYLATLEHKWGGAYLTRAFFDEISAHMSERILLIVASQDGKDIAAALNFIGDDTLYGRNWGAVTSLPFLHFETCYYQAIEYAIKNKLKRVEAGAQGLHKLQRGYSPALTYSLHYFYHQEFSAAIRNFCEAEAKQLASEIKSLNALTPYHKG